MSIRIVSLAVVALTAVTVLGTGTGSAQAACLAIPAPGEVDFKDVPKGFDAKEPVLVENKCGEKVKIQSTAFLGDAGFLLDENKCIDEEPEDKETCQLKFTLKPEKVGKHTAIMHLTYAGAKVKKDTFSFNIKGNGTANWRHHGTGIQGNVQFGLTGQARFQGSLGGVECQVTSRVTFEPGETGVVETFVPHPTSDTTNCKGLGGLAFCQSHDVTAIGLSWALHAKTEPAAVTLTNGQITSQATGGFCPVKHISLSSGTTTVTPNQPETVSSGELSGTLQAQFETNSGAKDSEQVTVSGKLDIESPNAATYSI